MKQPEAIPAKAHEGSPLPRFLRGLFRDREAAPASKVPVAAPVAKEVAPVEREVESSAGGGSAGPVVHPVDGHRPKILVVDDDAVVLKTLEINLSKAGCDVITGQDGSQAVSVARKEHPEVIVLDINFPPDVALAWDGIGVMQWLQRLDSDNTPPVIIISGMAGDQIRERALEAGAVAFLQKPVNGAALVEAINKALSIRPQAV